MTRPARRARRRWVWAAVALTLALGVGAALLGSGGGPRSGPTVAGWETTGNGPERLAAQPPLRFTTAPAAGPAIFVDDAHRYQRMTGFGAALTDSSAYVLMHDMSATQRSALLQTLFSRAHGLALNVLRVPIGASDFATQRYSEDDVAPGQRDPALARFSIAHDLADLIPVLREVLAINPQIELIATPWTAPAWMKTSDSLIGGTLRPGEEADYARYLARFVQAYRAQGITVSALTPQNEPDYSPATYPGMTLSPAQQAALIPDLAADLRAAGEPTRLLGFDGDWADAAYALSLQLGAVGADLAGTAFHCYSGDPSAQLAVHAAAPGRAIYETECTGVATYPDFAVDLINGTRTLLIDAVRDWSTAVLFWNLVLDQTSGPHIGGCGDCVPNVTVDSRTGRATENVEDFTLGQASRFVQRGAYRIDSSSPVGPLQSVAFQNPDGGHVLVVLNASGASARFAVAWRGESFAATLPGAAVVTFTW